MSFSVLLLLLVFLLGEVSALTCQNGGYKVTHSTSPLSEQCFCVGQYSGSECTESTPPSLTNVDYPCDPTLFDPHPDSCEVWLSKVNLVTSDPLQSRLGLSNYDTREYDRLTEPENMDASSRAVVAIDERLLWYTNGTESTGEVYSFDIMTGQQQRMFSVSNSITELVRSRFSDEVYVLSSSYVAKYNTTTGERIDIDGTSSGRLTPPAGTTFVSMSQIPGAVGKARQSVIVLLDDKTVYKLCDNSYPRLSSEDSDCADQRLFRHGDYNDHANDIAIRYPNSVMYDAPMIVIPDDTGAYEFTVAITYFLGFVQWVSSTGVQLKSCSNCFGLVESEISPGFVSSSPYIHTSEIYYDEARKVVILGEYSYGVPTAYTPQGYYLGRIGPNPGFHSSSTGVVIRPGPLARMSTFKANSIAIAGSPTTVNIYAKDYVGNPWTKDSSGNFNMEAHGTAKSGAAIIFTTDVVAEDASTGHFQGKIIFEETGTYDIAVTEGPGRQKLVHPTTASDGMQSVVVMAAATAARYSEMLLPDDCKNLKAGESCQLEVHPKDNNGNLRDVASTTDVFVLQVKDLFGSLVYETSTQASTTASLIKFDVSSSDIRSNVADDYLIHMTFNGDYVSGSPFALTIVPNDYNIDEITLDVEERGLYDPAEVFQVFEISLHDTYGNFISADQEHISALDITFYRPKVGFEFESEEVTISEYNVTASASGTIKVALVDDQSMTSDLRFTVAFTPVGGGSSIDVINPSTITKYFSIPYERPPEKLLTTEVIVAIAASTIFIIAFATFLIYREKLKTNKLKAAIKNQKFTQEEMRLLDDIMANSKFGDELTDTTFFSKDIEIKKRLGMGAFGEVFLAQHGDVTVAVKTLKQISHNNVVRFRGEMVLIKALSHPNIVQYMGCIWDREMIGLMLEFVDGGPLSDLLADRNRKLDWQEPKLMQATDIANAMVYLHSTRYWEDEKQEWMKCIIHRDLKPDNMLVIKDSLNIKLTDFGEARARKPDKTMTQVGTPIFIAPEVMKGDRYDERCDVFSYAICLLDMMQISDNIVELFAEAYIDYKHTDAGLSLVAITHSVVTEGLRPSMPVSVPKALRELVEECWDVNPEARPYFPEILDRLGYEVKADVFGLAVDQEEQKQRNRERMQRLSNATLETNREKVDNKSLEMVNNMFEDAGSNQSTARIDNLLRDKECLEKECKTLRAKNNELTGLLSGGYVPGAGGVDEEELRAQEMVNLGGEQK